MVRLRLSEVLKERKMTAHRLARAAGLRTATIYALTRNGGRVRAIRLKTVDAICAVLNCEPGELFVRATR
jgi:putative transcriptional regulator